MPRPVICAAKVATTAKLAATQPRLPSAISLTSAGFGAFCRAATTINSAAARQAQPPTATIFAGRPSSAPTGAAASRPTATTPGTVTASEMRIFLRLRLERKSVVWDKGVSVRVDLGGRGCIKKQKIDRQRYIEEQT